MCIVSEENLLNSLEFWILHSCNPTESYELPYSVLFMWVANFRWWWWLGGGGGGKRVVTSEGVMKFCTHNLCCLGKTLFHYSTCAGSTGSFLQVVLCVLIHEVNSKMKKSKS